MAEPRIAAGTAIAVTSGKPASRAIHAAMERAVLQAHQEGRHVDHVYLRAKIAAARQEQKERYCVTLSELETRVKAHYPGNEHVHKAIDYAMQACILAGLFDEHEIESRLIDAAKKAAVG